MTHFNTQRLTRMEMVRDGEHQNGASYKVTEREFLKLRNPDVHLTDVLEDRDGSLLVADTGGWFRIGCPSSLMAKPDIAVAIYRVRKVWPPRPSAAQRNGSTDSDAVSRGGPREPQLRRNPQETCDTISHK